MSYFGTDGIRGKFGELPITPEFALKLGFAAGKVLKKHTKKNKPIVVLGKDTRLSGYILEAALQAGLNAAGVYVDLLGPLPDARHCTLNPCLACQFRYCDFSIA